MLLATCVTSSRLGLPVYPKEIGVWCILPGSSDCCREASTVVVVAFLGARDIAGPFYWQFGVSFGQLVSMG